MNDAVLETLKKLVTQDTDLYTDWRRLEGFLRDYAGQHRREVNVPVMAAREGVPAELLRVSGSEVSPLVVDRLVRRLYEHTGIEQALAEWAVAGWAAALGKMVASRKRAPIRWACWGKGTLHEIALSPDGRLLAVASTQGVYLYNAETLEKVRLIETNARAVSVAFSPDGAPLASASGDRTVRLSGATRNSKLSPAPVDHTVRLWQVADGTLLRTLKGHTASVLSVAFAPDGALLASASGDRTVRLWRVADGTPLRTLEGHTDGVQSVAFAPDGALLASGAGGHTVRLWQVADGRLLCTLTEHTDTVESIAFAPDGELLASGSLDGTVQLWMIACSSRGSKETRRRWLT